MKLNKDANTEANFNQLTNFSKEGWKVKSISIDGWASPEGITVNDKLSENRANVVYDEVIKTTRCSVPQCFKIFRYFWQIGRRRIYYTSS